MTERQTVALAEWIAEARETYGVEISDWSPHRWEWRSIFRKETRPGRGHDLDLLFLDGESIVQITMDPYGNGAMSIGRTEWTHNSADDQCECKPGAHEYADEREQEPNEH